MIIVRVSTSNEFNDGLPQYAWFDPSTDLNFHIGWYMDTVTALCKDNDKVYGLEIFDYSPNFFQWYDGFDELLTKDQYDVLDNEGCVVFDGELNIPEDAIPRMDTVALMVCANRFHWIAYEKYSGDRCETFSIYRKEFKEIGLECD